MIPGRVWVNHLLTETYSGLHLKYAHMQTQTHMHCTHTPLFCSYFSIHVNWHQKKSCASLKLDWGGSCSFI